MLLRTTWFLDAGNRMNTCLAFGYFVPGGCNGFHSSFIDTHNWPRLPNAVMLLSPGDNAISIDAAGTTGGDDATTRGTQPIAGWRRIRLP